MKLVFSHFVGAKLGRRGSWWALLTIQRCQTGTVDHGTLGWGCMTLPPKYEALATSSRFSFVILQLFCWKPTDNIEEWKTHANGWFPVTKNVYNMYSHCIWQTKLKRSSQSSVSWNGWQIFHLLHISYKVPDQHPRACVLPLKKTCRSIKNKRTNKNNW